MTDYTHPVVWYWAEDGLWMKQGETLIGPVLDIYALNRDLAERIFALACDEPKQTLRERLSAYFWRG